MAPLAYDYLVLALGAEVNFFGVEGAAEHAFPMYTLADAVRLKEHVLRAVGGGRPGPVARRRRRAERRRRRRRPDRRRERRRAGRALPQQLRRGLPGRSRQDKARIILVEAGPALLPDVQGATSATTPSRRWRSAASRCCSGEVVAVDRADPRHAQVGRRSSRRTRSSGAPACRPTRSSRSLGLELQRGDRVAVDPDLSLAGHPEVFAVGDIAWITDTKTNEVLPQLGSVALQAGERAGENIARLRRGQGDRAVRLPRQGHDGDDRPRRRGRCRLQRRADDEGQDGVARLGRGAPRAAVHRRGPRQGGGRLDVGGVHPRARRPDHGANRPGPEQRRSGHGDSGKHQHRRGRRVRDLRDHRRSGEGDDLPLALPAGAARAAGLPDRRRGGRRLDRRPAARARPRRRS